MVNWWHRVFPARENSLPPDWLRRVKFTMAGWTEETSKNDWRKWRDSERDLLTLAVFPGLMQLPGVAEGVDLKQGCRSIAENGGGGLIQVHEAFGDLGPTVNFIYKIRDGHANIFTGMLVMLNTTVSLVWTIVSGEHGTTGVREAVITGEMFNSGKMTLETYQQSWAQDPYDPNYCGVDKSVLRYHSDDESYDERFPLHPLSKVRRMFREIPSHMMVDIQNSDG
jgi:hypothetical protein